jgi:hypothetical protein
MTTKALSGDIDELERARAIRPWKQTATRR